MALLHNIDPVSVEDHVVGFTGADQIGVGTHPPRSTVNSDDRTMRTEGETPAR